MPSSITELLTGIKNVQLDPPAKIVSPNTVEYWRDDRTWTNQRTMSLTRVIRFYSTDILEFWTDHAADNDNDVAWYVRINFGSWPTKATQQRINKFLPKFQVAFVGDKDQAEAAIRPMDGTNWYMARMLWQPFKSGLVIVNGKLPSVENNPWRAKTIDAAIKRFVIAADAADFAVDSCFPSIDMTKEILGHMPVSMETREYVLSNIVGVWPTKYALGQIADGSQSFTSLGYDPGMSVLIHAAELPARNIAAIRLGSKLTTMRTGLRKALTAYLRNFLQPLY